MRIKKIRGHRRRWKHIQLWIDQNKNLNLEYIKSSNRDYTKIRIHPWCDISITDSEIPELKGETRLKIIQGLLEIYYSWKITLDKLDQPYYLKIWLYEPNISRSQVVCATAGFLDFYETTFQKSKDNQKINPKNYGRIEKEISQFNWECNLDEDHFYNDEVGGVSDYESEEEYEECKIWFNKLIKKPHRTTTLNSQNDGATEIYSFKKGLVWIGEKQN